MQTAFLFPGQGSQSVGMGRALLEQNTGAQRLFAEASTVLGYDLAELCLNGPKERLNTTLYTQPALFTLSCALHKALVEHGCRPDMVAGHSVGEYAALVAAGVLDFGDGLSIIAERAKLMYTAGGGKMIAVLGLDAEAIEKALADLPRAQAGIGLYNAPQQVVVSGSEAGVDQAEALLKAAGARRVAPLAVSGAFHSELMRPVRDEFARVLAKHTFTAPRVPYISNLTADVVDDPEAIRRALADLLVSPVRWLQSVRRLAALGATRCLEVGPGRVLRGLVDQAQPDLACDCVGDWPQIEKLTQGETRET